MVRNILIGLMVAVVSAIFVKRAVEGPTGQEQPAEYPVELARADADRAYDQEKWLGAAEAYAVVTDHRPDDGKAWFRLAYSRHQIHDYIGAIDANRRAAEFPTFRARANYNTACAYALLGDEEAAIRSAQQAFDSGFRDLGKYESDPDLDPIRDDPRFVALLDDIAADLASQLPAAQDDPDADPAEADLPLLGRVRRSDTAE